MLGEFAALDPPNVDRAELDLFTGRRNAEEWAVLSTRVGASRDNLIAAKNTILDDQMEIGQRRVEASRAVDMRREARRVPAGPL
jgi:hypothetical protein